MYFNVYQLVQTGEERYFFELKKRFFAKDKAVPHGLMSEAGIGLENYTVKKLREGDTRFADEAFEIYRFEVENNYYLLNGKMTNGYYQNVAVIACETRNFEWADNFIENYRQYLPEEHSEDSYNYAKAHLLFGLKKFKELLRLLLSCNFPYLLNRIFARMLVAGAQYELNMLDELEGELAMLTYHLKDEKINEGHRNSIIIFTDFLRRLGSLKGNYDRVKLAELAKEIETKEGVLHRHWLLEKIKVLHIARGKRANTTG